jgi:hypothetical protein
VTASLASAQAPAVPAATPAPAASQQAAPVVVAPPSPSRLGRWIQAQSLQLSTRYRFVEDAAGVTTSNTMQFQPQLKASVRFDPSARYALHVGAFAGSAFTSSWNNTGLGIGDYAGDLSIKQLYAAAQPVKGLELSAGGLYVNRGESTEITSYDNDGFLVGERVVVKRPRTVYVDELSVTGGYLGDTTTPSVFRRFKRMDEHNYTQVLIGKRFHKRLAASADFTRAGDADVWRQGVRVGTGGWFVLDGVRVELYQRRAAAEANGFAVTGDRKVAPKVSLNAGYASVDRAYGGLNGDRFNRGNRVFTGGTANLHSQLALSWFAARAVNNDYAVSNRYRADVVLAWNALEALRQLTASR